MNVQIREHRPTSAHRDLEEQIRRQAYYLWQAEKCPDDRALAHWLAAEKMFIRHGRTPRVQLRQHEKRPLATLAEVM